MNELKKLFSFIWLLFPIPLVHASQKGQRLMAFSLLYYFNYAFIFIFIVMSRLFHAHITHYT